MCVCVFTRELFLTFLEIPHTLAPEIHFISFTHTKKTDSWQQPDYKLCVVCLWGDCKCASEHPFGNRVPTCRRGTEITPRPLMQSSLRCFSDKIPVLQELVATEHNARVNLKFHAGRKSYSLHRVCRSNTRRELSVCPVNQAWKRAAWLLSSFLVNFID